MSARTTITRWTTFNVVGIAGVAVQLVTLTLLTHVFNVSVAAATVLAVEAAVLHNFAWHQRWTWRDRPSSGPREAFARLLRFHAVNGFVSLVGNVVITIALVRVGADPLVANLAAIIACSLINFSAGERLVFRPTVIGPEPATARRGSRTPWATTSP